MTFRFGMLLPTALLHGLPIIVSPRQSPRICTRCVSQRILHLQQLKLACRQSQVHYTLFSKNLDNLQSQKREVEADIICHLSAMCHVHVTSSCARILKIRRSWHSTHFSAGKKTTKFGNQPLIITKKIGNIFFTEFNDISFIMCSSGQIISAQSAQQSFCQNSGSHISGSIQATFFL